MNTWVYIVRDKAAMSRFSTALANSDFLTICAVTFLTIGADTDCFTSSSLLLLAAAVRYTLNVRFIFFNSYNNNLFSGDLVEFGQRPIKKLRG